MSDKTLYKFDYFPKKLVEHWVGEKGHVEYCDLMDKDYKSFDKSEFMSYNIEHNKKDKMAFLLIDTNMKDDMEKKVIPMIQEAKKAFEAKDLDSIKKDNMKAIRDFCFVTFLRQTLDSPDIKTKQYEHVTSGAQMVAAYFKVAPMAPQLKPVWEAIAKFFNELKYIGFKSFAFDLPLLNPPLLRAKWKDNKGDFLLFPVDKNFAILLSSIPIEQSIVPSEQEWQGFLFNNAINDPRVLGFVPTQHFRLKDEFLATTNKKETLNQQMENFKAATDKMMKELEETAKLKEIKKDENKA